MKAPLVRVENVSRVYDVSNPFLTRVIEGEERRFLSAVTDVNFDIARGETFGLVGESGCGKTTLARLMVGLDRPTSGRVLFNGIEVGGPDWPGQRRHVQMVFQDPYGSLNPRWRVGTTIAEPIWTLGLLDTSTAVTNRVDELLELVGLDPRDAAKYPHEFSGGQRQRIAIARALASNADFVVCDEPTSALDVSVQAQVLNLMRRLQKMLGLTYIIISHDLAVIRHTADRIAVMYLGRVVEVADADDILDRPLHPYTQMLLAAVPDMSAIDDPEDSRAPDNETLARELPSPINPPSGCPFHPRCPVRLERCSRDLPRLERSGETDIACHAVFASNGAPE